MNTESINIHSSVLMYKILHYITLHTQVILYTHITNVKNILYTIFLNGKLYHDNQDD